MPMLTTLRIRFPVWPSIAAADAVREVGHLVEHGMDLRHDVLAVDDDRAPVGRAQGDVQDGPLLGDVDLLAAEHGVDARREARLLGQIEQAESSVSSVMRFLE